MFEWLSMTLHLDDFALIQIIGLSGVCGFIVSQVMQGWMTPALCNIGLFISAIVANMVGRGYGLSITHNKDLDGILFSAFGLIAGALLVVATTLLLSAINNRVGLSAQKMRERTDAASANPAA